MIEENLGLVSLVVSRMSEICQRGRLEREDAFAHGVEGLIHAVDNYDPSRGIAFASFALPRVRGAILDAVRRLDVLPRSLRRKVHQVDDANLELAHVLGRWPSVEELAAHTGFLPSEVRDILDARGSATTSLDALASLDESTLVWALQDNDEAADPVLVADNQALIEGLSAAVSALTPREHKVVELRYIRGLSFREIGAVLDISESGVFQLNKRIVLKLQQYFQSDFEAAA